MYDIDDKERFHVTHQADSLIHIYDKDFSLSQSYGVQGVDMDVNYTVSYPNWDDFNESYANDIVSKGYYYWLEYIDALDYTFRSYQKGSGYDCDGLQIYDGYTLIADVEVPKQFKVIGYIKPYFISQIIYDENDGISMVL